MHLNIFEAATVQRSPNMHLFLWGILTVFLLRRSSGTPLQIKNTLVPFARPNSTALKANEYVLRRLP